MKPDPHHAVLSPEQMALADTLAVQAGTPSLALMEAAGAAVAEQLCKRYGPRRVLIACGPGNNGGDGFVAARYLKRAGWTVQVALLGNRQQLSGDAARNAQAWAEPVAAVSPDLLQSADIVVDALFGAGLARPLQGDARAFVNALANSGLPVVAIDVPSGLDGATGQVLGNAAPATLTVTFFRLKPGHLLMPGRQLCGRVVLADIGLPDHVLGQLKPDTFHNHPDNWLAAYPWPLEQGHKYHRGHVLVAGGEHLTGAARLAARAAARAGAGLVTLAVPEPVWPVYAGALASCMVQALADPDDLQPALSDTRRNALVLGPGAGVSPRTRNHVLQALACRRATVLDADAISAFQNDPRQLLDALHDQCVLTPHEAEFARVFPGAQGCKLQRARQAAQRSGAVVVLKGADTVVAAPDGTAFINDNAPATLATGGTGDVLAGFIAGLLAQGMAPVLAAAAAVWLHGECATLFGPGLLADDLPELLPRVLRRLQRRMAAYTG
jgi:NAD(P)H-hydrate epimerase